MPAKRLYADFNATVPLRPEARAAIEAAWLQAGNASSVHAEGRAAKRMVEGAREDLAAVLGAPSQYLTFVSGATEGLHLALESAKALGFGPAFVFAGEHDAVWAKAQLLYPDFSVIPGNLDLAPDLDWLAEALDRAGPGALVVMQAANNETGAVMPIAALSQIVRARGGVILCDAAQSLGKLGAGLFSGLVDWAVISSHKIGGPHGAGAVMTAPSVSLVNHRPGGGQESGARAGTHNVPAIVGFAAAAKATATEAASTAFQEKLAPEVLAFETAVLNDLPARVVIAERAARLANTSCVALPGWPAEHQVIALDLGGAAVSAGAACSSGKVKTSRVLLACGHDEVVAASAIRVSFGWATAPGDGAKMAELYISAARRAGKTSALGGAHG